jgi:hypothetical protein
MYPPHDGPTNEKSGRIYAAFGIASTREAAEVAIVPGI